MVFPINLKWHKTTLFSNNGCTLIHFGLKSFVYHLKLLKTNHLSNNECLTLGLEAIQLSFKNFKKLQTNLRFFHTSHLSKF